MIYWPISLSVFIQQLGRGLRKAIDKDRLLVIDFVGNYKKSFIIPSLITGSFYPHLNKEMYAALLHDFKNKLSVKDHKVKFELPKGVKINFDIELINNMLEQLGNINPIRLGYIQTYLELKRVLGVSSLTIDQLLAQNIPVMNYIIGFTSWWNFLKKIGDLSEEQQGYTNEERYTLSWLERVFFEKEYQFLILREIVLREENNITLSKFIEIFLNKYENYKSENINFDNEIIKLLIPIKVKNNKIHLAITYDGVIRKSTEIRWDLLKHEINIRLKLKQMEFLDKLIIGNLYSRKNIEQILIRMGAKSKINGLIGTFGTGIITIKELKMQLYLVNMKKDKDAEKENIMYKDFIINHNQMNWESQNRTSIDSMDGKIITEIYSNYSKHMFVRYKKNAKHFDVNYFYLGKVHLVSFEGDKPIKVVWGFDKPLNDFMYDYLISAKNEGEISGKIVSEDMSELFSQNLIEDGCI